MSYEDIRIEGSLTEAMEAWVALRYGRVVDIQIGGINEGDFAAVGYAAVENTEAGTVDAMVLMLQHDPEAGPDRYRLKDISENEGPCSISARRRSSTSFPQPKMFSQPTGGNGVEIVRSKPHEGLRSR